MEALVAAFGIVFVAELGDKTQLVALGLGARHRLAPVLAGVAIAYAAATLLSVMIGGLLGAALPSRAIALGGGALFLGFALWTVLDREDAEDADADADADASDGSDGVGVRAREHSGRDRSALWSAAGAIFVAELGDKTMLATATLAAQGSPVLVWVGATVGIITSGALGVVVGRAVGHRLPARTVRIFAALLFAVFGIVLIATNL